LKGNFYYSGIDQADLRHHENLRLSLALSRRMLNEQRENGLLGGGMASSPGA